MDSFDTNNKQVGYPLNGIFILRIKALSEKIVSFIATGNEDDLHDSRVNARRLQTLFASFALLESDDTYREHSNAVDGLIKQFGRSRELDVCAGITEDFARAVKLKDSFISGLLDSLRSKIKKERKNLSDSGLIKEFPRTAEKMTEYFSGDNVFPANTDTAFVFGITIMNQLNAVLLLADKITGGRCSEKMLHKIRIKSKPLRYNIDFVSEYCGIELKSYQETMKKFVESAGAIHDADVLISRIRKYAKQRRPLGPLGKRNVVLFLNYLKQQRKTEFKKVVRLTEKIKSEKFRDDLYNLLFNTKYE